MERRIKIIKNEYPKLFHGYSEGALWGNHKPQGPWLHEGQKYVIRCVKNPRSGGLHLFTGEGKSSMRTLKTGIFQNPLKELTWIKKFGWYGVVFFLLKGAFWLSTPFIILAFN